MKPNPALLVISGGALTLLLGAPSARADFILPGDSASYAVLYEGSGGHNLQINSSPLNGSTIFGNVGLGDENGGAPTAQFNNPAVISGNVNFAGTVKNSSNAVINGTINGNVAAVENDLNALNALSSTLGAESGTALTINLSGTGGHQTVNASSGMLDANGNRVFNLTSLTFNNGNTLTINGDAAGDAVVINIAASNIMNAQFAGAIVLTGGLTANQVLINLTGGNSATLSGGTTLKTSANNAYQYATYLDPTGNINMNSVNIMGHVFGGDSQDMQITSGATITSPVPLPSALALFVSGVAGLLAFARRRNARMIVAS
jgi:hypothetical protein